MKISLSVRIVESPCKTELFVSFEEIVSIAAETGYDAICMRASAGGVQTPVSQLLRMADVVHAAGLRVSMVTADFQVPLNKDDGPNSLRDIGPSLEVASALHCDLVRVCLKTPDDIPFARDAAERASNRGIRLAHQCHTSSLFEEVGPMLDVVQQIDRPNFGIIFEPANLMLCGQAYDKTALEALKPFLFNVYVQNHRLDTNGPETLPTYCRGDVRFHHLELWEPGGVDFGAVFDGLRFVEYDEYFTIHQARGIETAGDARQYARRCFQWFRKAHGS